MKNKAILAGLIFMLQVGLVFGGLEWQTRTVFKSNGKEANLVLAHCYAQAGNLREEFVVAGKSDAYQKKGSYWIYRGGTNTVIIVDPEEKTYFEMDVEQLIKFTGALAQFIKVTITNPKAEVIKLEPEDVLSYRCNHILIKSSYDIEIKVAILKSKNHVEMTKEIWSTNAIPMKEFPDSFVNKHFKTGNEELDSLLNREAELYKNAGFVLKSVTTEKNTDKKGKIEVKITEMEVSDLKTTNLPNSLFEVPAGYKKIEFKPVKEY